MAPEHLSDVVTANMLRLREERGWSQAKLSAALRSYGWSNWTPSTVGLIEIGRQRADRLGDVAALCAVFGVSVAELMYSDEPIQTRTGPVPAGTLVLALEGKAQPPELAAIHDSELSNPKDLERVARILGLDAEQFGWAVSDVFGTPSFGHLRDARAGITPGMPAAKAAALRGHATRALLAELAAVLERDGIETVVERGRYLYNNIAHDDDEISDRSTLRLIGADPEEETP